MMTRNAERKAGTRKLRVLQLGSPSGLYGAERWILALIRHLDPKKIESVVASIKDAPDATAPLCTEASGLGFKSVVFHCHGKLNWSAVRKLKKFILTNGIDIVHTHGYKTDLIGYMATRGTNCRIVSTPHGFTKDPDLKLRLYELMAKAMFPLMDAVAPLSVELESELKRIPGLKGKLSLINNAVDIDEIKSSSVMAPEISAMRKDGEFIIGYIGRLTPGKGLDVLFDAVAKHGEPNWRLALVGDGEQAEELKALAARLGISERVGFFGFRPDRLAFLKGFDVFVIPSRSEGIPRCLMEAMIAGVPAVASDIPGCRNLVDGKTTGLLFPVDDPRALADSIKKLASDDLLRRRMSNKACEFIESRFSARRMATEYETLFSKLCSGVE